MPLLRGRREGIGYQAKPLLQASGSSRRSASAIGLCDRPTSKPLQWQPRGQCEEHPLGLQKDFREEDKAGLGTSHIH